MTNKEQNIKQIRKLQDEIIDMHLRMVNLMAQVDEGFNGNDYWWAVEYATDCIDTRLYLNENNNCIS